MNNNSNKKQQQQYFINHRTDFEQTLKVGWDQHQQQKQQYFNYDWPNFDNNHFAVSE